MSDQKPLIDRLRRHAYRIMEGTASLRLGYGVTTAQADQEDLERALHEAADALESPQNRRGVMEPLPARLRSLGDHIAGLDSGSGEARLLREAADEIERLRGFIAKLLDSNMVTWYHSAIEANHPSVDFEEIEREARAIMGEGTI